MLSRVLAVLAVVLHLPIIYLIYYLWQPIANWYLAKIPAIGVDLYLSATYATYHLKHLSLPFNSFKDIWFGGYPLMLDFPQLAFYLMIPFVAADGPVVGVQKFTMFALLILAISCYFLYLKLSRNHGFAFLLAILVLLSPNIYGVVTWAGSIPYFVSMSTFPLGLIAGAYYLDKPTLRRLAAAMLITGIGMMFHPLSVVTFLIPSVYLMILWAAILGPFKIKQLFSDIFLYSAGSALAGYMIAYQYVYNLIFLFGLPVGLGRNTTATGGGAESTAQAQATAEFFKGLVPQLFSRTNEWIYYLTVVGLVLFLVSLIFKDRRSRLIVVVPFIVIAVWAGLHPYLNLSQIFNIFRHDPYRAFWQFPIALAAVAAALWGQFFAFVERFLERKVILKISFFAVNLAASGVFVILAYTTYGQRIDKALEVFDTNVEYSSAFPEALSIRTKKEEIENLKGELLPDWIDGSYKNKRLYSADATVNIWWNSFYQMPLARGYVDPPIGTQSRGGFFWLDIAIANDTLVRDFKISEKVALENTKFLIDWYAIGYFEGGRLSSKGPSPGPSSYLMSANVFDREEMVVARGAVLRYLTASGKPELVMDLPQNLHFWRVSEDLSSPILYPTNATPVAVFTNDPGYEDILRIIATENINSKKLIPVKAGEFIDDWRLAKLKNFDALILSGYKYHNRDRAFALLQKYVEEGGKIFIDTGAETKESEGSGLAEIFPFDATRRVRLGRDWDLKIGEGALLKDVQSTDFGPLVFQEDEWKLSVPDTQTLREGSAVLLSHKDKPVLIEHNLGQGKVVWSGINLFYHFNQYKSESEAKLFVNILNNFVDLSEKGPLPAQVYFEKPEKVSIEADQTARGIMFKEEGYEGWNVSVNGKNLDYYLTGPTFPGFMYVPLKDIGGSNIKAEFSFSGRTSHWLIAAVNLFSIILLLDLLISGGRLSKFTFMIGNKFFGKSLGNWWRREEE